MPTAEVYKTKSECRQSAVSPWIPVNRLSKLLGKTRLSGRNFIDFTGHGSYYIGFVQKSMTPDTFVLPGRLEPRDSDAEDMATHSCKNPEPFSGQNYASTALDITYNHDSAIRR